MSDAAAGEVFSGRYVSSRELARGGMGRVLEVEDRLLHRRAALKTVLDPRMPDLLLRFVEEAQLTGQLSHPNVVPVHELGLEGKHPYLVMKLVEGRDLGAILRQLREGGEREAREWPLPRLLRAFIQACQAMAHAHALGVIHRDLKPANLMLGQEDELLVLDWGLARPWRAEGARPGETLVSDARRVVSSSGELSSDGGPAGLTLAGSVVGTPAYMPLEQAEGTLPLDPRADVYALGAILYELLTLRPPYEGASAANVLRQLFRGPPPPPSARAPSREVPPALESIVLQAMHRERDGRYPDAGALLRAVEAWLDDRPVAGHRESPGEALRRLARRHRTALVALGATLALLLAGALLGATVVRGWARAAEGERERAEAASQAAAREATAVVAVGRATREGEAARRAALDLERLASGPVPVERLLEAHAAAREEVRRRAAAVEEALGGAELDAASLAELRVPAREAAGRVDRALAEVLAGRAPRRGLEPPGGQLGLAELELGEERALFQARALARLARRGEALRLLQAAPPPEAEAARLAREALETFLGEERPLAAQATAVEAALRADPGAAWLHLLRADVHVRAGDLAGATREVETARALEPADPGPAWLHLRRLLPVHANFLILRAERELIESLAPELRPLARAAETVRHCGTSFMATWRREEGGKTSGIEPSLEGEMQRGELDRGEGSALLAEGALLLGRAADAERWARTALEARGGADREAQGLLAEALHLAGRADEAVAAAEEGLRRWPEDGRLAWVRGACRLAAGQAESAVPDLRLGARGGQDPWRWEALARALLAVGRPEALAEGVLAARTGLSLEPLDTQNLTRFDPPQAWDPRLQRVLGDLRLAQGRPGLAALHYTRALLRACVLPGERDAMPDLSDALRAGEALESLGVPQDAGPFYGIARQSSDPQVRAEAERRLQPR